MIMENLLLKLGEEVYNFRFTIATAIFLFFTAGIKTAPDKLPTTPQEYWTWGLDWLHQTFNLPNRTKQSQGETAQGKLFPQ